MVPRGGSHHPVDMMRHGAFAWLAVAPAPRLMLGPADAGTRIARGVPMWSASDIALSGEALSAALSSVVRAQSWRKRATELARREQQLLWMQMVVH